MDHSAGAGAYGDLDGFNERPSMNGAHRANWTYIVRFRNINEATRHPGFLRGYAFQGAATPGFNFGAQGFGAEYKRAVKAGVYGMYLSAYGESLARDDNFVSIDPSLTDAWGIPALHISMAHGSNEKALMEDASITAAEMLEAAGAKNIRINSSLATPGMCIHELGTARMGSDRKQSVVNASNQLHDVPNVMVMDGACFASSGCQNPTLTMMALTVRACDQLIARLRRNEA